MNDKNCISYWLPKVEGAGVPSPKTTLVHTDCELWRMVDGETVEGIDGFIADLASAASSMGLPCFLRSGHTSNKHNWLSSCFLDDASHKLIRSHVYRIVEFSELASIAVGLPSGCWAIRELLPVEPITRLEQYGMMPLVPELRFFVEGGRVAAWQPYWPFRAVAEGMHKSITVQELCETYRRLDCQARPDSECMSIVQRVASAFNDDDPFSVDVLKTRSGWYVTDMALAEQSFKDTGGYQILAAARATTDAKEATDVH